MRVTIQSQIARALHHPLTLFSTPWKHGCLKWPNHGLLVQVFLQVSSSILVWRQRNFTGLNAWYLQVTTQQSGPMTPTGLAPVLLRSLSVCGAIRSPVNEHSVPTGLGFMQDTQYVRGECPLPLMSLHSYWGRPINKQNTQVTISLTMINYNTSDWCPMSGTGKVEPQHSKAVSRPADFTGSISLFLLHTGHCTTDSTCQLI